MPEISQKSSYARSRLTCAVPSSSSSLNLLSLSKKRKLVMIGEEGNRDEFCYHHCQVKTITCLENGLGTTPPASASHNRRMKPCQTPVWCRKYFYPRKLNVVELANEPFMQHIIFTSTFSFLVLGLGDWHATGIEIYASLKTLLRNTYYLFKNGSNIHSIFVKVLL